eukprot:m.190223 g.190223  ORF g.190223 m.190223 type:complete len:118 (+) comp16753_c4_seq1:536-889(+)
MSMPLALLLYVSESMRRLHMLLSQTVKEQKETLMVNSTPTLEHHSDHKHLVHGNSPKEKKKNGSQGDQHPHIHTVGHRTVYQCFVEEIEKYRVYFFWWCLQTTGVLTKPRAYVQSCS